MATINLGNIKFNWKGTYNAGTAYAIDDVVSYNGSSYVCIQASTNNLPTVTAYWDIMSSAGTNGTNGTDVGTTLTTQGDILYRDGSGLQRLPKGTANQVLKMNSGATAPEYGTLSSDWVKISHVDSTSAVQIHNFQSVFNDSIYANYHIVVSAELADSDNVYARYMSGSSILSGANDYIRCGYQSYRKTDNADNQLENYNDGDGTSNINFVPWAFSSDTGNIYTGIMDLTGQTQSTSRDKHLYFKGTGRDNSGVNYHFISQGSFIYTNHSQAIDGIHFYTTNSNFQRFIGTIWGMKK